MRTMKTLLVAAILVVSLLATSGTAGAWGWGDTDLGVSWEGSAVAPN